MFQSKRVLLIIGGGIAAYKSLDLIRRLRERGIAVTAVLTTAAKHFVTPLSVAALSGGRVHDDLFSLTDETEMGHIELSRASDLIIVAPATADLIAKMAQGRADDLASTLLLATDKRALLAPAMNLRMWLHPATQRNVAAVRADGAEIVGPNEGEMACGEFGPGRMSEPLEIVAAAQAMLMRDNAIPLPGAGALQGRRVVITSGPTHEPIDPVRYIANRSSGKQGHAIARAAAQAGAQVTLISGPVAIADPPGVRTIHVETAREMLAAAEAALPCDIFIAAAAVADWRSADAAGDKIKKDGKGIPALALVENPDILAEIAKRKNDRPALVVGFAAETSGLIEHARAKLARKGCDLIVANDVSAAEGVMGGAENTVVLVTRGGETPWPKMPKEDVARRLVAHIAEMMA